MPTVLDLMGLEAPSWVEGRSLLGKMHDTSLPGREFTVTTVPFANPGDAVNAVDDRRRRMSHANVTTVTTDDWAPPLQSGRYALGAVQSQGRPEAGEQRSGQYPERAEEIHGRLVGFMRETQLAPHMLEYRKRLRDLAAYWLPVYPVVVERLDVLREGLECLRGYLGHGG